jgi:hypothetical protein
MARALVPIWSIHAGSSEALSYRCRKGSQTSRHPACIREAQSCVSVYQISYDVSRHDRIISVGMFT